MRAGSRVESRAGSHRPSGRPAPSGRAARAGGSGRGARTSGGPLANLPVDPRGFVARFRVPLIVAAVVLVTLVALYGPAKDCYGAWRRNGALQEEQAQRSGEQAELQGDVDALMTEEGIKDEARRRGYVDEGETGVVVKGLSEDSETSDDETATAETPWYLGIGDFIFQYDGN